MLKRLKNIEDLTYDDLSKSGLVGTLREIMKSKDSNELIKKKIFDLLNMWKVKFKDYRKRPPTETQTTEEPIKKKSENSSEKDNSKKEKKNKSPKKSSTEIDVPIDLSDPFRRNTVKCIYKYLSNEKDKFSEDKIINISKDIEDYLFKNLTKSKYVSRVKNIAANLMEPSNSEFRQKILSGTITVQNLLTMDIHEMAPSSVKDRTAQIEKDGLEKIRTDYDREHLKVEEGAYQCFSCKSKKIAIEQRQMRSADEPMTLFLHCVECGNNWRIG